MAAGRLATPSRQGARQRGYDTRWDKARATFLSHRPYCEMITEGRQCRAPATTVDHRIPHRGDQTLFWDKTNWQALCTSCHCSIKQSQERQISPAAESRTMPFVGRSRIPIVMVCGPPGSGKTTYVRERAGPGDMVIDLDVIRSQLAGTDVHQAAAEWTAKALDERNRMLKSLASPDQKHERAWFIIAAPDREARETWARKLGAQVVVLSGPAARMCRADSA